MRDFDSTRVEPYEVWRHHMVPPGFLNDGVMSPIYLPLSIGLFNLSFKVPGQVCQPNALPRSASLFY
eukprot:SAG22_NODE_21_length_31784_cov_15.522897_5_plen_67_part_00